MTEGSPSLWLLSLGQSSWHPWDSLPETVEGRSSLPGMSPNSVLLFCSSSFLYRESNLLLVPAEAQLGGERGCGFTFSSDKCQAVSFCLCIQDKRILVAGSVKEHRYFFPVCNIYMCVCVFQCVYVCRGQRSTLDVLLSYFFKTRSIIKPGAFRFG